MASYFYDVAPSKASEQSVGQMLMTAIGVQEKLAGFFQDRRWEPSRDADETASTVSYASSTTSISQASTNLQSQRVFMQDKRPPAFFFNKEWDLGTSANIAPNQSLQRKVLEDDVVLPEENEVVTVNFSRQRRCSFSLKLSDMFGIVLEETAEPRPGGFLVVAGVNPSSPFARTAAGTLGLTAGDLILEVDGRHGSATALREMLCQIVSVPGEKIVDLVIRSRPPTFNIQLRREGCEWQKDGMFTDVDAANPDCLLVERLFSEGLVPAWNAAHGSLRICEGDLITHINGVSQDVVAMKDEIEKSSAEGSEIRLRVVTLAGQAAGCQKELLEDPDDAPWPQTTVPYDMQVRWLDDNVSVGDFSTDYGSSNPSGTRTPEDSIPSGMRTPDEAGARDHVC